MSALFELENAGLNFGSARILSGITLRLHASEFVALAGPNGAGKSTLLSLLAGLLAPSEGSCRFLGRPAHKWPRRDFARRVAVVRQAETAAFPFTVGEIVAMGRMPHSSGFIETAEDRAAIAAALESTDVACFAHRDFRTLSGGERQRVLLASALAQSPEILLLDEPGNHLDLEHQIVLHRTLRQLASQGLLVIAATHDLNLAAAYADRIVLLSHGAIHREGTPAEILNAATIQQVFNVHVALHRTPAGQPWVMYGE